VKRNNGSYTFKSNTISYLTSCDFDREVRTSSSLINVKILQR